jgi:hypothetical protein
MFDIEKYKASMTGQAQRETLERIEKKLDEILVFVQRANMAANAANGEKKLKKNEE